MADTNIRVNVELDERDAVKGLGDIAEEATSADQAIKKLGTEKVEVDSRSLDDLFERIDKLSSGGAKRILLESNAKEIATQMADLLDQIDKADAQDITVDAKIEQVDALQGDLDRLEAKAKEISDTPVQLDTEPARRGLDEMGRSADSSKSVLANMVGNSVQDLGALSGVAGSAGVAIGQMGEYMADAAGEGEGLGSIIKNFGAVAGPLGGLAVLGFAFQALTDQMAAAKKAAEDLRKAQDALRQGDATQWIEEVNKQFGRLIPAMKQAGISSDDFLKVVRGETSLDDFRRRIEGNSAALELFGKGSLTAGGQLDDLVNKFRDNEAAAGRNTENYQFLADALGLVVTSTGEFITKEEALKAAAEGILAPLLEGKKVLEDQKKAQDEQRKALEEAQQAYREAQQAAFDYFNSLKAGEDSFFSAKSAQDQFLDSITSLSKDLAEAKKNSTDQADALRNQGLVYDQLVQKGANLAAQHEAIAEANAKENGEVFTAADAQRAYLNSLVLSSTHLSGPALDAMSAYISEVEQIPKEKVTEIIADPNKTPEQMAAELAALVPAGGTPAPITPTVPPKDEKAATGTLDTVAADRDANIKALVDPQAAVFVLDEIQSGDYEAVVNLLANPSVAVEQIDEVVRGDYETTIGMHVDQGDLAGVNATLAGIQNRTVDLKVRLDVIQSSLVQQLLAGARGPS